MWGYIPTGIIQGVNFGLLNGGSSSLWYGHYRDGFRVSRVFLAGCLRHLWILSEVLLRCDVRYRYVGPVIKLLGTWGTRKWLEYIDVCSYLYYGLL